ncbi:NAD-dependent epimerase/dehydratase [Mycolicibacterium phlei]|jgi:dihydroflavonol-4-reductase|uniref:Dehydrogenase n=1 Tax=Mycolicibacterium phlei DSM 43239 = CCUG 21000 TaxID=1226750 RepID=A0A5N5UUK5_MYCPH|nr:NAD-dependent epimerase/dehydratase family protein [Mycolicibacterium phlei]VEG07592.1 NAD-dependent epimerase/dehydratase [Mycobacteroides chelonae]AMO59462.1 3 beta-hydroxysteroid dehydrogenase/Delta 5-->4-isomerase [Mycolicibacterium phlei]EID09834.1 NAD-dependent epimerase/dehydratase [Mycolicibacterium phlei RIVM601174]KAB7753302.1 dehydrogenase [Mycolicibacterium phlei DSM 43239 = CCUG 21000]KXW62203.1 dehydrogenase [Mycolicibacterium phlei DSM 43239 = CCUG 21000]
MLIAVTGGTGYVGAHIVRALLSDGHRVRLLVGPDARGAEVLDRLADLGEVETLEGDIRDHTTIDALLDGCEAVLHGAGVVGTDKRRTQLMWEINAYATEAVLTRAVAAGLDPVVSVSSYSALFPPPNGVIGPDTPPAPGRSPYAKTKAYADRVARRLQSEGAPVVVTYPSSIVGPAFHTAPGVTERGWAPLVKMGVAPRLRGGMQMIDVRDVADVHAALMAPGRGPKRYVCGGVLLKFDEMIDALERGTDRRFRRIPISPGVFRALSRVAEAASGVIDLGDGLTYEAALLLTAATPTDDSQTLADLGLTWRSPVDAIIASFQTAQPQS